MVEVKRSRDGVCRRGGGEVGRWRRRRRLFRLAHIHAAKQFHGCNSPFSDKPHTDVTFFLQK